MNKKKVLVIYYSQTGQQKDILNSLCEPLLNDKETEIDFLNIEPLNPYPFPWDIQVFLDTFPESHQQIPCELKPIPSQILETSYDLILLSYQVWYLTPSIPINSFLKSSEAKTIFKNKPVVTIVSCRNMWFMAQEKMKSHLHDLNANHVGHIALVDKNWNHISLVTILHWAQTGRKDKKWGIFPKPGVSDNDIVQSKRFGTPILESLKSGNYKHLHMELLNLGSIKIRPLLIFIDKRGNFMFSKWSKLIRSKGQPGDKKRLKYVKFFYFYLSTALWVIAPIVAVLYYIFYIPFLPSIIKEKKYFKSLEFKLK